MIRFLVLTQLASTWAMVGLIWFVQIVHYPLFDRVGEAGFGAYEQIHQRATTWVVAPLMFAELISAGLLLWFRPAGVPSWLLWTGAGLVVVNWASTAFLQVPLHTKLLEGFDQDVYERLVSTNWIRTIAWSLRGLIVLAVITSWKPNV
ncbi:MAG: hypothetical protein RH917_01145 [Lacipirellulaceae bacterium]